MLAYIRFVYKTFDRHSHICTSFTKLSRDVSILHFVYKTFETNSNTLRLQNSTRHICVSLCFTWFKVVSIYWHRKLNRSNSFKIKYQYITSKDATKTYSSITMAVMLLYFLVALSDDTTIKNRSIMVMVTLLYLIVVLSIMTLL